MYKRQVEGAITHAPTLTVAYNSFIDLKNLLTIHYNREGQPEATKNDVPVSYTHLLVELL